MERRALGRSGLRVSVLALGTMNFGSDWHGVGAADERTAASLLDLALERGVTLIDTADVYGRGASEEMLGRLLRGRRREKVLLATKVLGRMVPGDPSTEGLSARWVARALDGSLRRLRTDRVDLYMPHGWDPAVPVGETLAALDRARRARAPRVRPGPVQPGRAVRRDRAGPGRRARGRLPAGLEPSGGRPAQRQVRRARRGREALVPGRLPPSGGRVRRRADAAPGPRGRAGGRHLRAGWVLRPSPGWAFGAFLPGLADPGAGGGRVLP